MIPSSNPSPPSLPPAVAVRVVARYLCSLLLLLPYVSRTELPCAGWRERGERTQIRRHRKYSGPLPKYSLYGCFPSILFSLIHNPPFFFFQIFSTLFCPFSIKFSFISNISSFSLNSLFSFLAFSHFRNFIFVSSFFIVLFPQQPLLLFIPSFCSSPCSSLFHSSFFRHSLYLCVSPWLFFLWFYFSVLSHIAFSSHFLLSFFSLAFFPLSHFLSLFFSSSFFFLSLFSFSYIIVFSSNSFNFPHVQWTHFHWVFLVFCSFRKVNISNSRLLTIFFY